jgi:hypothetical protein
MASDRQFEVGVAPQEMHGVLSPLLAIGLGYCMTRAERVKKSGGRDVRPIMVSLHVMAQPNNPLHGVTLERLLTELVERYGWDEMARRVPINCFAVDPSVGSSLKFLRKTPWARSKVEALYLAMASDSEEVS